MSSPHGGIASPSYTDADIRRMITKIIASPSPPVQQEPGVTGPSLGKGHNSFQEFQGILKKYFGAAGGNWPEPGLRNKAHDAHIADDASWRLENMNEIEQNYTLATTGKGTVQPHEDPGQAKPGAGPVSIPNPLAFLQDLWGLITNGALWLRVGEFILGAALVAVGVAHISPSTGDTITKVLPIAKAVIK